MSDCPFHQTILNILLQFPLYFALNSSLPKKSYNHCCSASKVAGNAEIVAKGIASRNIIFIMINDFKKTGYTPEEGLWTPKELEMNSKIASRLAPPSPSPFPLRGITATATMGTLSDVVLNRPPPFERKGPPSQQQTPPRPTDDVNKKENPPAKESSFDEVPPSEGFGPRFRVIPTSRQLKELQTIIRDKNTSRSDFKFYADRLIRLVVEDGLNQLPYSDCCITTPTGCPYKGLKFTKGNCGVSIVRSGEAMEQGLRSCCRSIRIGKILVESDADTHEAKVVYAKFPDDISQRKVLLMYPIMSSGNTVIKAVNVLKDHLVSEANVILLNLFSTPMAARSLIAAFPKMTILTSEVNSVAPNHFGQKYFGTD